MMKNIEQHIIRINVRGKGYSLYTGNPEKGFIEQDLDVVSDQISRGYLLTQKRLDESLSTGKLSWSMSFRHDTLNKNPIVAYGIFTDACDDKGRSGISFIHAIEVNYSDRIPFYVEGIISLLSHTNIRVLIQIVADTAIGRSETYNSLDLISRSLEKKFKIGKHATDVLYQYKDEKLKIRGIEHDCAGAAAIAWLSMAFVKTNTSPPWEVYDTIDKDGKVQTLVNNSNYDIIPASSILRQNVKQYLNYSRLNEVQKQIHTPVPSVESKEEDIDRKTSEIPESATSTQVISNKQDRQSTPRRTFLLLILALGILLILALGIVVIFWVGKGTNQKIEELRQQIETKNEEIEKLRGENEKYIVLVKTLEGEIALLKSESGLPKVEIEPKLSDSRIAVLEARGANIRSGPSTNHDAIAIAMHGDTLVVVSEVGKWLLVRYKEKKGYINRNLVKLIAN